MADGVVQGASVVRRLMEGGPDAVGAYVADVRAAVDAVGEHARRSQYVSDTVGSPATHRRARRRWPRSTARELNRTRARRRPWRVGESSRRASPRPGGDRRAGRRRHRFRRDHGDVRLPAGAVLRRRREGAPRLRPRDRRSAPARDRTAARGPGERHAVAGRAQHGPRPALPGGVGRQPPTAALRRRRPADLDRRGDRPGRRRPAVHAPRQRRLRRRRRRLHVPAGDRAHRRRTAHRPRRRGDRRTRPAGAHLLLARPQRRLGVRRRHRIVVGGRSAACADPIAATSSS